MNEPLQIFETANNIASFEDNMKVANIDLDLKNVNYAERQELTGPEQTIAKAIIKYLLNLNARLYSRLVSL